MAGHREEPCKRTWLSVLCRDAILAGYNDLASCYPEVSAEWSSRNLPLLPSQVTKRSIQKVWWQDSFGHEWQARIADRVEGHGCPYCNDGKLLAGFNDLATCFPEIAAEWSEANFPPGPEQVKPKSRRVVWWCCADCGHEWKAVINTRVFSGQSCPACSRELRRHKNAWKYDKDAGAALIAAYKDMKQANKAVPVGEYLGMQMSVIFDSFDRKFTFSLKGEISHSVEVVSDAVGNISRIGNVLEGISDTAPSTYFPKSRFHKTACV